MARYYFDVREGDSIHVDNEGAEISSIDLAWTEAARTAAEMSKDGIHKRNSDHRLAAEVRDNSGPVISVSVTFETLRHRQ